MSVAAYTLRIREQAGDDSRWQETRIVAASLAQALAKAQLRFGEDRVMAVAQDVVGEPLVATDTIDIDDVDDAPVVPEPVPDPQIVHVHDIAPDTRADAFVAAVVDAVPPPPRPAPMPWEGRWRPSNLIWIGVAAGLLAFVSWYQFGAPARDRFVTAAPQETARNPGLALGDTPPRGGVLAATGTPVRPGDDSRALGEMVGEAVADVVLDEAGADPHANGDGAIDDPDVRTIGTIVGEMFSRWPNHEPVRPDRPETAPMPSNRVPQRYRYTQPYQEPPPYDPRTGERVGEPLPAPPPMQREPSMLRPYFVGVDRGNGVMETLRVPAYDADHARAIVADLPERPIIVRGPSPRLDW